MVFQLTRGPGGLLVHQDNIWFYVSLVSSMDMVPALPQDAVHQPQQSHDALGQRISG